MPQKSKVLLYPPRLSLNKRSDRYNLFIDIKWGTFERQIQVNKEAREAVLEDKIITSINEALLEASETTKPYTLHE